MSTNYTPFTPFEERKIRRELEAQYQALSSHMKSQGRPYEERHGAWIARLEELGYTYNDEDTVLGAVGYSGTKTHKIRVSYITHKESGKSIITHAYSRCGSQKWTPSGRSGLSILSGDPSECTCTKCAKA